VLNHHLSPILFEDFYVHFNITSRILTTLNGKFLQGDSQIEVYSASIGNEVGWPAFTTEKGSS
jgi:hypothetical protein